MEKLIAGVVLCAVVFGGGGYYAGKTFGARSGAMQGNFRGEFAGGPGGAARGQGATRAFNMTAGEVIAQDDTSITIRMQDGSTKIVLMGQSTQITKSAAGTSKDLAVGTPVAVMGAANQDGSVTAESVQIRPEGFGSTTPRMRQ